MSLRANMVNGSLFSLHEQEPMRKLLKLDLVFVSICQLESNIVVVMFTATLPHLTSFTSLLIQGTYAAELT
jgi:hypothetical protein